MAHGPVVQRHDTWPTSRRRWFNSIRDYLPRYANGRAARLRVFRVRAARLQVRLLLWAHANIGSVGNLADHLDSDSGMLWVQIPPEPLQTQHVLVEQRSARLPVTQETVGSNPIGDACDSPVRKLAKRPSSNLGDSAGSTPARATDNLCVGWALASLSGRNPPVFRLCRFNSCPAH